MKLHKRIFIFIIFFLRIAEINFSSQPFTEFINLKKAINFFFIIKKSAHQNSINRNDNFPKKKNSTEKIT